MTCKEISRIEYKLSNCRLMHCRHFSILDAAVQSFGPEIGDHQYRNGAVNVESFNVDELRVDRNYEEGDFELTSLIRRLLAVVNQRCTA